MKTYINLVLSKLKRGFEVQKHIKITFSMDSPDSRTEISYLRTLYGRSPSAGPWAHWCSSDLWRLSLSLYAACCFLNNLLKNVRCKQVDETEGSVFIRTRA